VTTVTYVLIVPCDITATKGKIKNKVDDNTKPFARMGRKAYRVSQRQPGRRNTKRYNGPGFFFLQLDKLLRSINQVFALIIRERKMDYRKETRQGRNGEPRLFFIFLFALIFSVVGQTVCFASTVVIQWEPVTDANLKGYKVYYRADSSAQPFQGTGATQGASPLNIAKDLNNTTYTCTISGLDPARAYYFAVTAYSTSGVESAYSNIIYVPSFTSPTVTLTAPANNSTLSGNVSVTATASDDVGVTKVEFYLNDILQTTDATAPYTFNWDTSILTNGSYTLSAKAYDAENNIGQSSDITVTINNPVPAINVSISSPADSSILSGTTTIRAAVTGDVSISKVEFYVNNVLKRTDSYPSYTYTWNTTTVPDGPYTVIAKAYDTAGDSSQSPAYNLVVKNNSTVQQTLSVTISGNGTGNINSNPSGFTCLSGTCTDLLDNGSTLTLIASPGSSASSLSYLSAWTGACSGTNSSCTVTMDANKSATATFATLLPVHINGGSYYSSSLQSAYGAAVNNGKIMAQAVTLSAGNLTTNLNNTITLKGGYNANYSSVSGATVMSGTLSVAKGTLIVENLVIK
jgi:chitinase